MTQIEGAAALSKRLNAITDGRTLLHKLQLDTVAEAKRLVLRKTGNLGRSIHVGLLGTTDALVVAGAGYAAYVESGTRPHEIRPRNKQVLRFPSAGTAVTLGGRVRSSAAGPGAYTFAAVVHHPGTKPHPFLLPAAKKAVDDNGVDIIVELERGRMTATTFRRDTADRLLVVLNAFITANPTLLKRAYRSKPESSPDFPCAYIDYRSEVINHSQGVRDRQLNGLSFKVVDRITNNDETMQRMDILVDALIEHLTAYPQLGGTVGIWSQLTVTDEDAPFGDYDFFGVRFGFPDISIQEGRHP